MAACLSRKMLRNRIVRLITRTCHAHATRMPHACHTHAVCVPGACVALRVYRVLELDGLLEL